MSARTEKILNKLKERNLKCPDDLELFDEKAHIRELREIAGRAVVAAVMAKCAFYLYEAEDPDTVKAEYVRFLEKYGVDKLLFQSESEVLNEDFNEPLCDTVGWRYEAANALLWALGIVKNIDDAGMPDDIETEINRTFDLVNMHQDMEAFINSCTVRCEEDLLDAYQLYWYYLWNIRDGMIFGGIPKSIFYDVVLERRRALEWLVFSEESDNGDWEFGMHT